MNPSAKKMSLMGLFIALGISLGFALVHVPNVELVTATIFIAGYLLGIRDGIIVGLLTETLYSLLNPYGLAAPPLFIAQVLSMSLVGAVGGFLGRQGSATDMTHHLRLGLAGFLLTTLFAVLTTLSFVFFLGFSEKTLLQSFVYGLGFYIIHILSNTLIFLTLVPVLLNAAQKTGWFRPAVREETA